MLIELMSAKTRGAASPACEAALSMMGRTPWGLAGKINERGSTCFREMVSAVTHGVLRGFDQVHAFGQQGACIQNQTGDRLWLPARTREPNRHLIPVAALLPELLKLALCANRPGPPFLAIIRLL